MPHPAAAPPEADDLHHLVRVVAARVHIPVALLLLLLAPLLAFHLAAALFGRPCRPARTPQHDWYPGSTPQALSENTPEARAARRLRAWIGWILRGQPARGMTLSGARAPAPAPLRTARAPPPQA